MASKFIFQQEFIGSSSLTVLLVAITARRRLSAWRPAMSVNAATNEDDDVTNWKKNGQRGNRG